MKAEDTLFNINWGDGDTFYIIAPDEKTAIGKMTDGKDMVNYAVRLDAVYKMIFKAGYDKALAQLADMTEECKQMGRREVAKWITKKVRAQKSPSEMGEAWVDGYVVWLSPVDMDKLKEWLE